MFYFRKNNFFKRCLVFPVVTAFAGSLIVPLPKAGAQGTLDLPQPGAMVGLSPSFTPPIIKGMIIHPDDPLVFDFIIHPGDDDSLDGEELRKESVKLIKYFMAALTVPEDDMWVNLSPYEKDRIIPAGFGNTEMGRDLLAQDYLLKQLTASLMYPEDELGGEFWKRVKSRAYAEFGTTAIPTRSFNKIWIVPERADIYQNGTGVFVVGSRLKVMLETDYLAMEANAGRDRSAFDPGGADVQAGIESDIIREVLIPEIEKEVNEGKAFTNLRQIYNAVILAAWHKQNLKKSLLGRVYVDQNKTKGIDTEDKQINQKIYDRYLEALKVGVYDFVKEDYDPATQEMIPKKYFSGGVALDRAQLAYVEPPAAEFLGGTHRVRVEMESFGDRAMSSARDGAEVFASVDEAKERLRQLGRWDIVTVEFFQLAEFLLDLDDEPVTGFVQLEIIDQSLDHLQDLIDYARKLGEHLSLPPGVENDLATLRLMFSELNNNDDDPDFFLARADRLEKYRNQVFTGIRDHFIELGQRGELPEEIFHADPQTLFADFFLSDGHLRHLLLLFSKSVEHTDTIIESVDVDALIRDQVARRQFDRRNKPYSIEMLPEGKIPEITVLGKETMPIILSELFRNADIYGQNLFRVQRLFDEEKGRITILLENDMSQEEADIHFFQWFRSIQGFGMKSPISEETGSGLGVPISREWALFHGGRLEISLVREAEPWIVRTEIVLPVLKPVVIAGDQGQKDSAMLGETQTPGGIDLNPGMIGMNVSGENINIPLPDLDPQQVQQFQIDGFAPLIINITPVTNPALLLGIAGEEADPSRG